MRDEVSISTLFKILISFCLNQILLREIYSVYKKERQNVK